VVRLLISNEQREAPVTAALRSLLRRAVKEALALEGRLSPLTNMEVSMVLVDDDRMAALNEQYRGIAGTTDVLAFPMISDVTGAGETADMELLLGDIVISVPQAIRQAKSYGNTLQQELIFLAVHGMLHLLGYDDQDASGADRMQERGRQVMDRLGLGVLDRQGTDNDA
jgi:probable rRNA maturation factor